MFFTFSPRSSLKECWAPGARPGVVVIFTCLFRLDLHCLIRQDLTGKSSITIDNSQTNSSLTPNLSIKNRILSTVVLYSSLKDSYFHFCGSCSISLWVVSLKSTVKVCELPGSFNFKKWRSSPNILTNSNAFCALVFNCLVFCFEPVLFLIRVFQLLQKESPGFRFSFFDIFHKLIIF